MNARGRPLLERLSLFFTEEIWAVRVAELRRGRALLYRASRVAYSTVRGFFANRLTVRAASLTYYRLLPLSSSIPRASEVLMVCWAAARFSPGTPRPLRPETSG